MDVVAAVNICHGYWETKNSTDRNTPSRSIPLAVASEGYPQGAPYVSR